MIVPIKDIKTVISKLDKLDYLIAEKVEWKGSSEWIIHKANVGITSRFFSMDWIFQILKNKDNQRYYACDIENIFKLDNINQITEVLNILK